MNANELITILGNVAPETEIKVTTARGSFTVREVATLGYNGGTALIVADD